MLRCLISQLLGRSNQVLQSYRKDRISHVELELDLPLLLTKKNPLLIDVGANAGQTISMFKRVFDQPVIHAFEPNKTLVETRLAKDYGHNKNIVLNAAGLGAEPGVLKLNHFEKDQMCSFLPLDNGQLNPYAGEAVVSSSEVPVWTLDQYAHKHSLGEIDLLKIDTQGYDLQVLLGAEGLLAAGRVNFIMLEINFIPLYVGQPEFFELDSFLSKRGYALVDLYEKIWVENRIGWCNGLYQKI
ncbi:FkbM family methyltransferase [Prosthecobacter vanneervenii]|uniref:FkbM family methyltransferase n=1 Tax=Prosthecobacter vanneervenii TaxID=48466 RepID=A0A7W8DHU5_9BACT|nr:FkbM family methyltransferase [Prosthecobacter vanneervenii]